MVDILESVELPDLIACKKTDDVCDLTSSKCSRRYDRHASETHRNLNAVTCSECPADVRSKQAEIRTECVRKSLILVWKRWFLSGYKELINDL